ncbi:MAG: hypothetical protein MJ252_19335 [archaeon]|nr:hypothetical protein [archaeon]
MKEQIPELVKQKKYWEADDLTKKIPILKKIIQEKDKKQVIEEFKKNEKEIEKGQKVLKKKMDKYYKNRLNSAEKAYNEKEEYIKNKNDNEYKEFKKNLIEEQNKKRCPTRKGVLVAKRELNLAIDAKDYIMAERLQKNYDDELLIVNDRFYKDKKQTIKSWLANKKMHLQFKRDFIDTRNKNRIGFIETQRDRDEVV